MEAHSVFSSLVQGKRKEYGGGCFPNARLRKHGILGTFSLSRARGKDANPGRGRRERSIILLEVGGGGGDGTIAVSLERGCLC